MAQYTQIDSHSSNTSSSKTLLTLLLTGTVTAALGGVGGYWFANNNDKIQTADLTQNTAKQQNAAGVGSALASNNNKSDDQVLVAPSTTAKINHSPNDQSSVSIADEKTALSRSSDSNDAIDSVQNDELTGFSSRLKFMQAVAASDAESLEALISELPTRSYEMSSDMAEKHAVAMMRLIEIDPARATQFFKEQLTNIGNNSDSYTLLSSIKDLPAEHSKELLTWATSTLSGHKQYEVTSVVLSSMAERDPILAMELSKELPSQYGGTGSIDNVIYSWSYRDPQAALDWYLANDSDTDSRTYIPMLISNLARVDPDAAEQAALQITDESTLQQLNHSLISGLASTDPQAAMEKTLALADEGERNMIMYSVIMEWSAADGQAALAYVDANLSGDAREIAMTQLAESANVWQPERLGQNPSEAFAAIEGLPGEMQTSLKQMVVSHFMHQDPQGTLAVIDSVIDPTEQARLYENIAWELPSHDMARAQELFNNGSSEIRSMMSSSIANELYRSDPQSAWQFFEQTTEPEIRENIASTLVGQQAQTDPIGALETASSLNFIGSEMSGIYQMAFFQAVATNKVAAQTWLEGATIDATMRAEFEEVLEQMGGMGGLYPFGGAAVDPVDYYQSTPTGQ